MKINKDGSYLFTRDELLRDNFFVASKVYFLMEHQFYVLIENGDTRADIFASRVFYMSLGVLFQILVFLGFVCYYNIDSNKDKVDSTLSRIDEYQIGFLLFCLFVCGVSKIIAIYSNSDRKRLISEIKSHFNKK